jgi:hypothetical protein
LFFESAAQSAALSKNGTAKSLEQEQTQTMQKGKNVQVRR